MKIHPSVVTCSRDGFSKANGRTFFVTLQFPRIDSPDHSAPDGVRSRFVSSPALHLSLSLARIFFPSHGRYWLKMYKTVILWVLNLVFNIKRRTETEGVWEQGAEGNVWALEGGSDWRLEKIVMIIITCTSRQILLTWSNQGGSNGQSI
jgi:hypothetical protein